MASGLDLRNLTRLQTLKETPRLDAVKLGITRLNAQEEAVARDQGKARHVEQRVVRHGQAVEGQHAQDGRQGGDQDRQLKGHRNEGRPTVQRASADVQRVVQDVNPVLQKIAAQAARKTTQEH